MLKLYDGVANTQKQTLPPTHLRIRTASTVSTWVFGFAVRPQKVLVKFHTVMT